jgi:hypothetical protein
VILLFERAYSGFFRLFVCLGGAAGCALGAPILSGAHQFSAQHENIGEGAGDEQAIGVFIEAAIAHFGQAEDTLDDTEGMLDFSAHFGFWRVLCFFHFINTALEAVAPVGEILRLGRTGADLVRLALLGAVAPDAGFLAV